MSKEIIEVNSVNAVDDVARVIVDFWTSHNNARVGWMEKNKETRAYLTADNTSKTEVGALPWKNKTTIPKLTQLADNLHSYYMAAMMPNDDWFRWEGANNESQKKAEIIEEYMKAKVAACGFRTFLAQAVQSWIYNGNVWAGVEWAEDSTINPITGETVTTYIGPRPYVLSPYDCLMNPRSKDFSKTPFIARSIVHITEVLGNEEYRKDSIGRMKGLRSGAVSDGLLDSYKESGLLIDGFNDMQSYLDTNEVELLEYWGDVYLPSTGEYFPNQKIIIADRAFVLLWENNPTLLGVKPFVHCGWRMLPHNLYAQGPLDQLVGMQYRCDHLENLKADAFDRIIHPMYKVVGDAVEDFQEGPGVKIFMGTECDVVPISPDVSVLSCDNQVAYYHSLMELMAGSPKEMMGFRTPGEKTAFEVQVLQAGVDRMFIDKVNHFEENFIKPILNLMFELVIRNLDIVDVIRTFNDEKKMTKMLEVTQKDVAAIGSLRPVGSSHYSARNKRVQELNNLLQISSHEKLSPHFSGLRAGQALEEELGFTSENVFEKNVGIKEAIEAQAFAQMEQQRIARAMDNEPNSQEGV